MNNIVQDIMDEFANLGFLSHNYGSNGKSAIGMWREEQMYLLDLALRAPYGNFLEVGSFQGGSACLLGGAIIAGERDTKLYCVDIDFSGHNNAFDYNVFKRGKFGDVVSLIETNTKYLAEQLDRINDLKIGFAFLDGYHSYKAVVTEFEAIKPYLVDDAIVALHDAQPLNGLHIEDVTYRANIFYNEYMNTEMPDVDSSDLAKYHAMEQKQDFLILEAACYLKSKYNLEFITTPDDYKCDYSHITGGYKHGQTSPYNSILGMRYNGKN